MREVEEDYGDPRARLLLQQAAEAGSATAALELGATYDPTILKQDHRHGFTLRVPHHFLDNRRSVK